MLGVGKLCLRELDYGHIDYICFQEIKIVITIMSESAQPFGVDFKCVSTNTIMLLMSIGRMGERCFSYTRRCLDACSVIKGYEPNPR